MGVGRLMSEGKTKIAITITRALLLKMFDDPFALAFMTYNNVNPEEVEDKIHEILAYLKKTAEEAEG